MEINILLKYWFERVRGAIENSKIFGCVPTLLVSELHPSRSKEANCH